MKKYKSSIELKIRGYFAGLKKGGISYGFTNVKLQKNILVISHNGNMGNSVETSVNPNLNKLGFPTVDELKNSLKVIEEKGSPDYSWCIKFDITSPI